MKSECACLVLLAAVAAVTGAPGKYFQGMFSPGLLPSTAEPVSGYETVSPVSGTGSPALMKFHPQRQQVDEANMEEQEASESDVESESAEEPDTTDGPELQDAPDAAEQGVLAGAGNQAAAAGTGQSSDELAPAAFMKIGGSPFNGIKQAVNKNQASKVAGRTITMILGALFLVVAAATVAAVVVIRKQRRAA